MTKVWVEEDEWYPTATVYFACPGFMDQEVFDKESIEVSPKLLNRYQVAKDEYAKVNRELLLATTRRLHKESI